MYKILLWYNMLVCLKIWSMKHQIVSQVVTILLFKFSNVSDRKTHFYDTEFQI